MSQNLSGLANVNVNVDAPRQIPRSRPPAAGLPRLADRGSNGGSEALRSSPALGNPRRSPVPRFGGPWLGGPRDDVGDDRADEEELGGQDAEEGRLVFGRLAPHVPQKELGRGDDHDPVPVVRRSPSSREEIP